MNRHKKMLYPTIWALFLIFVLILSLAGILSSCDYSGPVLSEMNPNGTVDTWYLFDNASKGGR